MILEIFAGVVAISLVFYYWSTSTYNFWQKLGVPGPEPTALIGNLGNVIRGKKSIGTWLSDLYEDYQDVPLIGAFSRRKPVLIIRDLNLVKDVLVSDFSKFTDRPMRVLEKADPLSQSLLGLEYKRWRPLRSKLSPVFTSGKLKDMFYILINCGNQLQEYMDKTISENNVLEARDLTSRFTIDVIGTCAFGLELHAMADEDSAFRKMAKYIFTFNWKKLLLFQFREFAPSLFELLAPIVRDRTASDFFINLMNDTMKYRRENNVVKHDFLDFLMEIQDHPEKIPEVKLTDSLLASQLFIFFAAGFETSSTTMSHALYELAQHHDIQEKLREEIRQTKEDNGGDLTYFAVKNMKYMDMIFKETLRKYPPGTLLFRAAKSSYTFSGTNVTIPKNQQIMIPVYGIQHDPKIYSNPEKFDPENFTEEAIKSRHPMSFLSFGDGPRNCIGMRFAYQQTKVGLIKILERYRVNICDKTDIPYKINPRGFLLAPLNGIHLKFEKI